MTTLTLPPYREASLPSLGEHDYVVLGKPMDAVVGCVIETRNVVVDALRFTFWRDAIAFEVAESAEQWSETPLTHFDLDLASDLGSAALMLVETQLPHCGD